MAAAGGIPGPKVFITYRREETGPHAGRLYDAMVARFGEGNVFMDVDMAPGVDFIERITEAVAACHVLIVVMGPRWATVEDERGRARLADPEDFVRLEVETALRRPEVTPIPVLVAGAQMPNREDLPEEVRAITRRNALELSDVRWRQDVGRLIGTLDELLAEMTGVHPVAAASDRPPPSAGGRWRRPLLAGLIGLVILGLGAFALISGTGGDGSNEAGSGGSPTSAGQSNPEPGGIQFESFDQAQAFTVEVPVGWTPTGEIEERYPATDQTKTTLLSPKVDGLVEIVQEPDTPAKERLDEARAERAAKEPETYEFIEESPHTFGARETLLFGYRHDETELGTGQATVYSYFFNDGGSGWRTRAVGDDTMKPERVLQIATRMAETLEPSSAG